MAGPTSEDVLFSEVALLKDLVREEQVRECLTLLGRGSSLEDQRFGTLGKLMLAKGYITLGEYRGVVKQLRGQRHFPGDVPARPIAARRGAVDTLTVEDVHGMDFASLSGAPLGQYLEAARSLGASDLHIHVGARPFVRLHGRPVYLRHPAFEASHTERLLFEVLTGRNRSILETRLDAEFVYEAQHGRYRTSVYWQRNGLDAVFHVIPDHVPTLEELGLPESLRQFTLLRQGLVLVTGPAGCGKSATMAALLDIINEERHDHIVTIEDPIEYLIPSKTCNVNQRQVRAHTESFASALRSAMRADPDYICVGEMNDLETISTAITAAETGHLVFATLHTTNATRSIDRIIDVFPPSEQEQIRTMVSESLRGVISQQLIPRANGLGRVPALEILVSTPAVANLIRERKTFNVTSVLQTGAALGMTLMDESIAALVQQRIVSREEARYRADNPDRFR